MAYKMKGAPMYDTSSKHGTNANYKKSGAPNMFGGLGKMMDPLGLFKKKGGKGRACPPAAAAAAPVDGAAAAAPAVPTPAAQGAAAAPAAAAEEEAAAPTMMKKGLKNGAPMKEKAPGATKAKKKVDPRTDPRYAHKLYKKESKKERMKPSPAKGKLWDALKKGDFKGAGKTLKHEAKGIGAGVKAALTDDYNTTSKKRDIENAYYTTKRKSASDQKLKDTKKK